MEKISKTFNNNVLEILLALGALGILICYGLGFGDIAEKNVDIPSAIIIFSIELFLMIALCIFAKTIGELDKMLTVHAWAVVCYGAVILALDFFDLRHPGIAPLAVLGLAIISFFVAWLFLIFFSRNWPNDYSGKKTFY